MSVKTILTGSNHCIGGLHYCVNHRGKMMGLYSLSTSPLLNQHCVKRSLNPNTICSKCYAVRQLNYQTKGFPRILAENTKLLQNIIPIEDLPIITVRYFRFESFGDIYCRNQVINYFNICKKNPNVHFALWTKNPGYIAGVINEGIEKPKNLNIILSSPFVNKVAKNIYNFIDKVFSVFSKEYAEQNDIVINCGANSCAMCGKCYEKNDVNEINEILK